VLRRRRSHLPRAAPDDADRWTCDSRSGAQRGLERRQFATGVASTAAVVGAVATGGLGSPVPTDVGTPVNDSRRGREEGRARCRHGGARVRAYRTPGAPAPRHDVALAPAPSRARTARRSRATRSSASPTDTAPDYPGGA
jgi:hypothetical protein